MSLLHLSVAIPFTSCLSYKEKAMSKNVKIGYNLSQKAREFGIAEHLAAYCFASVSVTPEKGKELTFGEKAAFVPNLDEARHYFFDLPPVHKGVMVGEYPTVRFSWENCIHLDRADEPVFIPEPFIREYAHRTATFIAQTPRGQVKIPWPGSSGTRGKPKMRIWTGLMNRVFQDQCKAVLMGTKFEGQNEELLRQFISGERDLYVLYPNAPLGSYRPRNRSDELETDDQGRTLWNEELLIDLPELVEQLSTPKFGSEINKGYFVAEKRGGPGWVDKFCITGTYVESENSDGGHGDAILANQGRVPKITGLIILRNYDDPERKNIGIAITDAALRRFMTAFVDIICDPNYPARVGFVIQMQPALIPQEAFATATKAAPAKPRKKMGSKEKPAQTTATAEVVKSGNGGASMGEILATKGQSLGGGTTEGSSS